MIGPGIDLKPCPKCDATGGFCRKCQRSCIECECDGEGEHGDCPDCEGAGWVSESEIDHENHC